MASTTFSGPIKAGTIANTTGTTVGDDVKNVGFVKMAQTASWTQSTTAADTGIVIPANSQIVEVRIYITTACDAANISVGTSNTSNELFSALAAGTAANVIKAWDIVVQLQTLDTWKDVGSSSDVTNLYVEFSQLDTTGRGYYYCRIYTEHIINA